MHGRYITIINDQRRKRYVIIISEMTFNTGWLDIARKIERFINYKAKQSVVNAPRIIVEGLLYSHTTRGHKWSSKEMNDTTILTKGDILRISGVSNMMQNDLLSRSLRVACHKKFLISLLKDNTINLNTLDRA